MPRGVKGSGPKKGASAKGTPQKRAYNKRNPTTTVTTSKIDVAFDGMITSVEGGLGKRLAPHQIAKAAHWFGDVMRQK